MFHAPRPSLAYLVLALALVVALPATAAANADPVPGEVVADTFSVADLARSARQVPLGGKLFVSGVALEPGAPAEALELERFRVLASDARIVVHGADGDVEAPAPDILYFRGRVAGDLASLAVLSVREDGRVRGLVQQGGRTWSLGRQDTAGAVLEESRAGQGAAPQPLVAVEASAQPPEGESFTCGQDDLPLRPEPLFPTADALTTGALTTTPYTALVAVETDYEFYDRFDNVNDATAYVLDLFAYASSLYDQEINTSLQVGHLSLWTASAAADPWTQTSTTCGMFEFGRYWNDNNGAVDRTIAHFMSGKSNGGGVAWVGVLCNGAFNVNLGTSCPGLSPAIDNYGGAYGYSGDLDGNFDPNNPSVPLWDWVVVSHEIGHNFNSPHTHCYGGLGGSPDPVDECFNGEGGCFAGASSLPCGTAGAGCGTIMSYCHFQSGGLANIAPSFGTGHPHGTLPQRVPDRMRTHVEAVAGSNASCLARLGCYQLTMGHTGTGTAPTALPANSPGCQAGFYDAGELIRIDGAPAAGWRVGAWSGTDDDASPFIQNAVTMPAANHAVNADYLEGCNGLALTNGTDNGTIVYDACDELTAGTTYRVGATGDVTLRSYQRVVLTDGFRVDSGGTLAVVVPTP